MKGGAPFLPVFDGRDKGHKMNQLVAGGVTTRAGPRYRVILPLSVEPLSVERDSAIGRAPSRSLSRIHSEERIINE